MSDKIVPLHANLRRNSGRKLIELQVMNYSKLCLEYADFTQRIMSALEFTPKDVALSMMFKFQYIIAERYMLGFEKYHYYVDTAGEVFSGEVAGACVYDLELGENEPDGWSVAIADDSIITLPDREIQDFIIREINRGNVENG